MNGGRIFNVQRFSVHDGPGIRTTVFLKGCPLSCRWCHNPEGMSSAPELMVVTARCIHCGRCVESCPSGRLAVLERGDEAEVPECILCGTCAEVCPVEARRYLGRILTVEDVLSEVLRDRIFYDSSGGGVTFSGGEPLAQPRFLADALDACRRHGIHTAVDTCGFCRRDDLLDVARRTDLFLFDLKVMDEERHRRLTGVSNVAILENLKALARIHHDVRIRIPVIPGANDSPDDIAATARFAASLPGVRRVSLLPFHQHGEHKRRHLAAEVDGDLGRLAAPARDHLELLANEIAAAGLEPHVGG